MRYIRYSVLAINQWPTKLERVSRFHTILCRSYERKSGQYFNFTIKVLLVSMVNAGQWILKLVLKQARINLLFLRPAILLFQNIEFQLVWRIWRIFVKMLNIQFSDKLCLHLYFFMYLISHKINYTTNSILWTVNSSSWISKYFHTFD